MNNDFLEIGNRNICKIGNQLIEAKYKLTLEEQRLILLTIAQIDTDDEDFKIYNIKLKDLEEKTGHFKKYSRLKKFMETIMKKPIWLDENLIVNWFSSLEYKNGEGRLEVCFDPKLKPFLLALKKEFTKLDMLKLLNLQSTYAVRIYQLLKQYEKIGYRKFSVDKLREMLQTPKSYSDFFSFKTKVLNVAKEEINHKTDLEIDWEVLKRERKKVVEIKFVIQSKPTSKNQEDKLKEINTQIASKKIKELNNSLANIDDFKLFRTKILKEYRNKLLVLNERLFSIKGVYLALNDKILKADEALEEWHLLFEKRQNIEIIDKEEYAQKQKERIEKLQHKIDSIKEKIFYQIVDYGEFKDEFEFRVLQFNEFDQDNEILNVMFEMVEDKSFNFNVKGKVDTFFYYNKFSLDPENNKFEWLKE